MSGEMTVRPIAHIRSPYVGKFGIPRQSGRVKEALSRIVFEPEYRNAEALRGMEGYSHLWLIWQFSEALTETWSPTVRPPRLGGNRRMGVFATRSPYRPNALGLSCVKIENIVLSSPEGPYLEVSGGDLLDGTPIYDIKPYLPTADCYPQAVGGFADDVKEYRLDVADPENLLATVPDKDGALIVALLAEDPRPSYHNDPERRYTFECAGYRIVFTVTEGVAYLRELDIMN